MRKHGWGVILLYLTFVFVLSADPIGPSVTTRVRPVVDGNLVTFLGTSGFYIQDGGAIPVGSTNLWQTDGTNVWRPTGNVGIGNVNPIASLHVRGDTTFEDDGSPNDTLVKIVDAGDDGVLELYQDTVKVIRLSANAGHPSYINDGGNVGIGTAAPATALEINGALTLDEMAEPTDPADGKMVLWFSNGTGAGTDGDVLIKKTVGGVVTTNTIDLTAL